PAGTWLGLKTSSPTPAAAASTLVISEHNCPSRTTADHLDLLLAICSVRLATAGASIDIESQRTAMTMLSLINLCPLLGEVRRFFMFRFHRAKIHGIYEGLIEECLPSSGLLSSLGRFAYRACQMASITPLPKLGPTLGAMYLGGTGAAMLFGTTNLQIYLYFRNYKQDVIFQKCAVIFLWLFDSLHMAFVIAELWHYMIDSFGNYIALDVVSWSFKVQISLAVVIVLSVQSLYTLRVWKLSRHLNRRWPWVLIVVLVVGYATGIILIIKMCNLVLFSQMHQSRWSIYMSFSMASFTDIMLTVAMCHLLYIGTTIFAKTKSMVGIVTRYVIVSGALTSMCSIAGLTSFFVMPDNFVFLGITFVLTKLYFNSYLAMLNARKSIRNSAANMVQASDLEGRIPTFHSIETSNEEVTSRLRRARVVVSVDVTRQRDKPEDILYVGNR
ncbi:hypothetical protein AX14_012877, partial [Amanita brunnescens Koide BX004]